MNELPKGWEITTLGELGTWSSGGTPSRKNPEYYGGSMKADEFITTEKPTKPGLLIEGMNLCVAAAPPHTNSSPD